MKEVELRLEQQSSYRDPKYLNFNGYDDMKKFQLFSNLIILSVLMVWSTSNIAAETSKRGKITGGVMHSAPNWFKENFLDIAEDVEEATSANRQKRSQRAIVSNIARC